MTGVPVPVRPEAPRPPATPPSVGRVPGGLPAGCPTPAPSAPRGGPPGPAVSLRDVSLAARRASGALVGIDLEVAPGELVALLGPVPSGADAVLRLLTGHERAGSGTVTIDGRPVGRSRWRTQGDVGPGVVTPAAVRGLGERGLGRALTVRRALTAAARRAAVRARCDADAGGRLAPLPGRLGAAADRPGRTVDAALDAAGLAGRGDEPVRWLGLEGLRRLALARALVDPAALLLLDEPFGGLDAAALRRWRDDLGRAQRSAGLTVVLATHDQASAFAVADRVAVLHDGRIGQVDSPEQLCTAPASAFVAGFLGADDRVRTVAVDGRVRLPGAEVDAAGACEDGPVVATVHPQDVVFAEHGAAGVVEAVTFLGAGGGVRSRVRLADGSGIVLEHPARERRAVGEVVHVRVVARTVTVVPADED